MVEALPINFNFQSLLDTIGLVQGTALGILLLILNRRQYRSSVFLGLFLLVFSLKLIPYISISIKAWEVYPEMLLLPLNFSWLLFALFFVYTQQISVHSINKTKYWVLYPGLLSILLQLIIYFLPYGTKLEIAQSAWYPVIFTYLGMGYSWAIGIWNLRLINEHNAEVQNSFSLLTSKQLGWARVFLIYSLVTSVIIHLLFIIAPQNQYFKIFFSIIDLFAIYWISYHGVVQRNVLSILSVKSKYDYSPDKPSQEAVPFRANTGNLEELMAQIDAFMMSTESFIHSELTIVDLAEKLKVHPKRISTTINSICRQNFNSYVNRYRVKKAEALLKNHAEVNMSMEGIGIEVGFNSKSAFYSAFKKVTGSTPNKFKEDLFSS